MAASAKVALVTGAGTGVGRAVSLALAKDGYDMVLAGRRKEMLDEVAGEVKAGGAQALAVPTDVSKRESILALFATVKSSFGRLDVLFNNAGIGAPAVPLEDLPYREMEERGRHQPHRHVPVHAGSDQDHEGPDRRAAGASSTTARSRRTRRGPIRSPIPRPSTPSPASPNRPRSTAGNTTSPAGRSTSATPRPR